VDLLNKTRAATQDDHMNKGELALAKPMSRAAAHSTTTAFVDARQVDVYGSTGSPLDSAG